MSCLQIHWYFLPLSSQILSSVLLNLYCIFPFRFRILQLQTFCLSSFIIFISLRTFSFCLFSWFCWLVSVFLQLTELQKIILNSLSGSSCVLCSVAQSCLTLWNLWTVAHQAPLSVEFFRQEYWSGLPFPAVGDLPNPRIEPASLGSPALTGRFFTTVPPGKPLYYTWS